MRFTKLFHHDFYAYKTLANVNFEASSLYAYICDSPFQMPSIFNFFSQNINTNSKGKNMIWMKDVDLKVYILGKKLKPVAGGI